MARAFHYAAMIYVSSGIILMLLGLGLSVYGSVRVENSPEVLVGQIWKGGIDNPFNPSTKFYTVLDVRGEWVRFSDQSGTILTQKSRYFRTGSVLMTDTK